MIHSTSTSVCWLMLGIALSLSVHAQEKYKDFDDAFIDAARYVRKGDYPAAVAPLEAALGMAKDDSQRMKAYEALVPAYRQSPDIDKMLAAQEFVIRHTDRKAGRSLAARDVASYLFTRGKLDAGIQRYDGLLKQNPKDPAALTILTMIYTQSKRNDPRGPTLKLQLDELDRELSRQLAERLEKDAESAPRTSASHLKDAATAWLEAGDKTKALAAAKKSVAGPPEQRTPILAYHWRSGLGDVFLQTGEPQLAISQFEAALASTDQPALKKSVEKKLSEARGSDKSKP
jgi:tetratricopeptide (TPR) repeat protein